MLRTMLKGAAAFFAVGLVVGALMPAIATAIGATALITSGVSVMQLALWEGALFGAFGFLAPPLQKLCNTVFGDPEGKATARENAQLKAKVVELQGREALLEQTITPRHVQKILAAGTPASFADSTMAERIHASESPTIH